MGAWRIKGLMRESGAAFECVIDADSRDHAIRIAGDGGIVVSSANLVERATTAPRPATRLILCADSVMTIGFGVFAGLLLFSTVGVVIVWIAWALFLGSFVS